MGRFKVWRANFFGGFWIDGLPKNSHLKENSTKVIIRTIIITNKIFLYWHTQSNPPKRLKIRPYPQLNIQSQIYMKRLFGKKKEVAPPPSLNDAASGVGTRVDALDEKIKKLDAELRGYKEVRGH
jgi:hypothetical protein